MKYSKQSPLACLVTRIKANQSGAAMIEFALAIPVFIVLLAGTIELSNYVYAVQKAERAVENIVNIINLQELVSTTQLESMSQMLPEIMKPIEISDGQYKVVVTSMQRDQDEDFAYVNWQKEFGNLGLGESHFPYTEDALDEENILPEDAMDGFVFFPGDQVMVVEAYVLYEPVMPGSLVQDILSLGQHFLYVVTPPARPRSGAFQFDPDDLV